MKFFICVFVKDESKAAKAAKLCEDKPRKHLKRESYERRLDNQMNAYHIKKLYRAPANRPEDLAPPCKFGPDVGFLDEIKKK